MRIIKWVICSILTVFIAVLPALEANAYNNRSFGWGYNKSKNEQQPDAGVYGPLLQEYGGFYLDQTNEKNIYLTFDNGYEQGHTGLIMDVLKDKGVPATFFVTGHYIDSAGDLVKRMVKEGHIVGNHSWSHPDFTKLPKDKIKKELTKVSEGVKELTGKEASNYLRPPQGVFSERSLAVTQELGYTNVFWSIAFVDWHTNNQKGWEYAYKSIIKQIHPGAIILLHTVSEDNALALENLIDEVRKRGYTFKSLDDIMWDKMLPDGMLY